MTTLAEFRQAYRSAVEKYSQWDESEHPRDKTGRFASKESGGEESTIGRSNTDWAATPIPPYDVAARMEAFAKMTDEDLQSVLQDIEKKPYTSINRLHKQAIRDELAERSIDRVRHGHKVGDVIAFVRHGKPPESGISTNNRDEIPEKGVSVYLLHEGKPEYVGWYFGMWERPAYSGIGQIVDWGSDGEPVVEIQSIRRDARFDRPEGEVIPQDDKAAGEKYAQAALWDESEHPRDREGKFSSTGVGRTINSAKQWQDTFWKARSKGHLTQGNVMYLTGVSNDATRQAAGGMNNLGLLITPHTPQYADHIKDYPAFALDNGVWSEFTGAAPFSDERFMKALDRVTEAPGGREKCLFVVAPDVVGDAKATRERSAPYLKRIRERGLPAAYVLQNGIKGVSDVPWDDIDVLFLGGTTAFKLGFHEPPLKDGQPQQSPSDRELAKAGNNPAFFRVIREARRRKIPVHMGRVNSFKRMEVAGWGLGSSTADGTFLGYGPKTNLPQLLKWLKALDREGSGEFYRSAADAEQYRQASPAGWGSSGDEPADDQDEGLRWINMGGARVQVNAEDEIVQGCPGLEGSNLADLGEDEDPEHRRQRAEKQKAAEAEGWESNRQKRLRETWRKARDAAPEETLVMLKSGSKLWAFEEDARQLLLAAQIGNGDVASFDEDKLESHLEALLGRGIRVAVAEPEKGSHQWTEPEAVRELPENAIEDVQMTDLVDHDAISSMLRSVAEYDPTLLAGLKAVQGGIFRQIPGQAPHLAVADTANGRIWLPDGRTPADAATLVHELTHLRQKAQGQIPPGGRDAMTPDEFNALEGEAFQAAAAFSRWRETKGQHPTPPSAQHPARISMGADSFEVSKARGMWFFRRSAEAGWTAASPAVVAEIDKQLGGKRTPPPSKKDLPLWEVPGGGGQVPGRKRALAYRPKDAFERKLVGYVGDDPEAVEGFRSIVNEVSQNRQAQAMLEKHAVDELIANFVGSGGRRSAFTRELRNAEDMDSVRGFDEIVEMAQREYPFLLNPIRGEPDASDEDRLWSRLKKGRITIPSRMDDEIFEEAAQMVDYLQSRGQKPRDWEDDEFDDDQVPFSRGWWEQAVRYARDHYATQLELQWGPEEERLHPRGDDGKWTAGGGVATADEQEPDDLDAQLEGPQGDDSEAPWPGQEAGYGPPLSEQEREQAAEFLNALNTELRQWSDPPRASISQAQAQDGGTGLRHFHLPVLNTVTCDDPPEAATHRGVQLEPLENYDRVLIQFSGGKDSVACVLHMLEIGVPKEKIELWHQKIDGEDRHFFDWPVTDDYCQRFAKALGLKIRYQWRDGGFEKELTKDQEKIAGVWYQDEDGEAHYLPTTSTQAEENTRRKFPALSPDLSKRWCSASLKIQVASRAITNDPALNPDRPEVKSLVKQRSKLRSKITRLQKQLEAATTDQSITKLETSIEQLQAEIAGLPQPDKVKYLFISGERREESPNRAKYLETEEHGTHTQERTVHHWRPVIDWQEKDVWDIAKRNGINPHPAYHLGYNRLSCQHCVFADEDQVASNIDLDQTTVERIAQYERDFGHTIRDGIGILEFAAAGMSLVKDKPQWLKKLAMAKQHTAPIHVDPDKWELPFGAFKRQEGPDAKGNVRPELKEIRKKRAAVMREITKLRKQIDPPEPKEGKEKLAPLTGEARRDAERKIDELKHQMATIHLYEMLCGCPHCCCDHERYALVRTEPERYRALPHDDQARAVADATARANGAVGGNAKVPAWIMENIPRDATILDFGAGHGLHVAMLRKAGFQHVTAWDYGSHLDQQIHDPHALDRAYDVVYASNVLNVQSSADELERTIREIAASVSPGGVFVGNLPSSPRKDAFTGDSGRDFQLVEGILQKYFGQVQVLEGGQSSPIYLARRATAGAAPSQYSRLHTA